MTQEAAPVRDLLEEWQLTPDGRADGRAPGPHRGRSAGGAQARRRRARAPGSPALARRRRRPAAPGRPAPVRAAARAAAPRGPRRPLGRRGVRDRRRPLRAAARAGTAAAPAPVAARCSAGPSACADAPLPRRLVEQAVALAGRSPPTRRPTGGCCTPTCTTATCSPATASRGWRSRPKPLSGDPHFEVAPLLWHRWDELDGDVRRGVRARFHAAIDAAMLDEDRARDWVVVRAVLRAAADPGPGDRAASRSQNRFRTEPPRCEDRVVATVISVNVGTPRDAPYADLGRSAMDKRPVPGRVPARTLGLDGDQVGDTQAPRRRRPGGLRLRPRGPRLLGRRARPGDPRTGMFAREPHHPGHRRQRGRGRGALADRHRRVRGREHPDPVQRLQELDGPRRLRQPGLGQAVRQGRPGRARTCGSSARARSAPATRSRSCTGPGTASPSARCSAR